MGLSDSMGRLWEKLFGRIPSRSVPARKLGAALLKRITEEDGALDGLSGRELVELVEYLLTNRSLRRPLRGSAQFLESVTVQFRKKGRISSKQRRAILNILERAYPHNLAYELRNE